MEQYLLHSYRSLPGLARLSMRKTENCIIWHFPCINNWMHHAPTLQILYFISTYWINIIDKPCDSNIKVNNNSSTAQMNILKGQVSIPPLWLVPNVTKYQFVRRFTCYSLLMRIRECRHERFWHLQSSAAGGHVSICPGERGIIRMSSGNSRGSHVITTINQHIFRI